MKRPITIDFFEKGANVNSSFCKLLRQYSPYLLNDPRINYYCLLLLKFFTPALADWFLTGVTASLIKSPGLPSVFCDLNNAIVWISSTRPLTSKSSRPSINPSMTVTKAPIIIGITVTFLFYSYFSFLARSRNSSFFLFSFNITLWSTETAKSTSRQILFF